MCIGTVSSVRDRLGGASSGVAVESRSPRVWHAMERDGGVGSGKAVAEATGGEDWYLRQGMSITACRGAMRLRSVGCGPLWCGRLLSQRKAWPVQVATLEVRRDEVRQLRGGRVGIGRAALRSVNSGRAMVRQLRRGRALLGVAWSRSNGSGRRGQARRRLQTSRTSPAWFGWRKQAWAGLGLRLVRHGAVCVVWPSRSSRCGEAWLRLAGIGCVWSRPARSAFGLAGRKGSDRSASMRLDWNGSAGAQAWTGARGVVWLCVRHAAARSR